METDYQVVLRIEAEYLLPLLAALKPVLEAGEKASPEQCTLLERECERAKLALDTDANIVYNGSVAEKSAPED